MDKFLNTITKGVTPYLIIAAIITGVYFQTLSFGLINLDDDTVINTNMVNIHNSSVIKEAFTRDAFFSQGKGYYRPLLTLSFIFNQVTTGDNLFFFHLTNLILHITLCCLLFYLLCLFKVEKSLSLIFSVIFAVHPLFINAVVWLVARSDLFVTVFLLSSFIMFIKFEDKRNVSYLIFHFIFFGLALFSKEVALVSPFIFIIYLSKFKYQSLIRKENLLIYSVWIIIIIPYLILRSNVNRQEENINISNFLHNLPFIPEISGKFFTTFNLSGLPTYNTILVISGIILFICLGFLLFKNKGKINLFQSMVGLLWITIFSIPGMSSRYLETGGFDYLECRTYLPLIGIIFFLASVFNPIFHSPKKSICFFSLIVIILSFNNIMNAGNYSNPMNFYDSVIQNGTKVALAYYGRGLARYESGDQAGAYNDYNKAIELKPDYMEAYNNRGLINFNRGNFTLAKQDYDKAIRLKPDFAEAYCTRADINKNLGDIENALKDYNKAIELKPNYSEAYNNRGILYYKIQNYLTAKTDFEKSVKVNPNNSNAWKNLGITDKILKNMIGACEAWKKAAELGNKDSNVLIEKFCK